MIFDNLFLTRSTQKTNKMSAKNGNLKSCIVNFDRAIMRNVILMLMVLLFISGCSKLVKIERELTYSDQTSDDADNQSKPYGLVSNSSDHNGQRTVIVKGIGDNYEIAKKDAFQNAISEVINSIIQPEARATLEESIIDAITSSNDYIVQNKIVSRKRIGGLVEIKLEAVVQQSTLESRLVHKRQK
ncbi:MAG: hypothetical protein LBQ66_14470 [Planctomycetaceae bacterium]|jgi:hypothetical protein|nr:hypothetical protein [Planctomycetaceae bacterium]